MKRALGNEKQRRNKELGLRRGYDVVGVTSERAFHSVDEAACGYASQLRKIATRALLTLQKLFGNKSDGVFERINVVPNDSGVSVNFKIISPRLCLVTKKVNVAKFIAHKLKAIGFVPSLGEHVKADLAADGILQTIVGELALQSINHFGTDLMLVVILFEIIALRLGAVPSDWGNVEHTVSELDECTTLDRNIKVSDHAKRELDKHLQTIVPEEVQKRLAMKLLSIKKSHQAILGEHIIELLKNIASHLFLLLLHIAPPNKANGVTGCAQRLQTRLHLGRSGIARDRQGPIDIEQNKCVGHGAVK